MSESKKSEFGADLAADRVTPAQIREDPDVRSLIRMADSYLEAIGYTDHGFEHVGRVAARCEAVLNWLEFPPREVELAVIAAYLHDIGNLVHRDGHPQSSALLAMRLLDNWNMPLEEAAIIAGAIGNHDETNGLPVSPAAAALIIADKTDVLRARVRNPVMIEFDIHDRVNYAAESCDLILDKDRKLMSLHLTIDNSISTVMEYFEIFLSRTKATRHAANYLNCDFKLIINDTELA